jgi:hypothetical protein
VLGGKKKSQPATNTPREQKRDENEIHMVQESLLLSRPFSAATW